MTFVKPIQVAHLRDLQRDLKSIDADLAKGLRKGLNEVAEIVAAETRRRVPSRTGKARSTVKAASTQTAAAIRWAGPKAPYYPWLEFGGRVGPNRSVRRRFIQGGRYLYPTIRANRDDMLDMFDDVIVRTFKKAGWDG